MKVKDIVIDTNWDLFEAAYPGNLGLMELVQFYNVATPEQKQEMDEVTNAGDWKRFKELVYEVLGVKLI